jgi:hypothetical protein
MVRARALLLEQPEVPRLLGRAEPVLKGLVPGFRSFSIPRISFVITGAAFRDPSTRTCRYRYPGDHSCALGAGDSPVLCPRARPAIRVPAPGPGRIRTLPPSSGGHPCLP